MAVIQTTGTIAPALKSWDTPQSLNKGPWPEGEYLWEGSVNAPVIGAGDQSQLTIDLTIPQDGHFLRIVEADFNQQAAVLADIDRYEAGRLILSPSGSANRMYLYENGTSRLIQAAGTVVYARAQVPNQWCLESFYGPNDGVNAMNFRIVSAVGASGVVTTTARVRALKYSVQQVDSYSVHTPLPTITC